MLAADVSKYTGTVSEAQWTNWKSVGGELAIVGSWHGTTGNKYAHQTLYNAQAAGLHLATYAVISRADPTGALENAKGLCGDKWDDLLFCALDVEIGDLNLATLAACRSWLAGEGLLPIIYTYRWWWETKLDNPNWGSKLGIPLWAADYDGHPVLDFPQPYGGWTGLAGKQFTDKPGWPFNADASVFDRHWVAPCV